MLHEEELLKQMVFYATSNECLRVQILRYFGENSAPCGHCGNCEKSYETVEVGSKVRIILCALRELEERNRFFGRVTLRDFFKGAHTKALLDKGLDRTYGYGLLSHLPAERILQILDWLVQNHMLIQTEGQYPVLRLGTIDRSYWTSEDTKMKASFPLPREKTRTVRGKSRKDLFADTDLTEGKEDLFEVLRSLRKEIADEQGVPAFIIFSNATLAEMALVRPTTMRQLLSIKGVGVAKANQYGQRFIACIREFGR